MTMARIPLLVAAVALTLTACGADKTASPGSTSATKPTFTLTEFRITLDGTIRPGEVAVTVDNRGRETHELVIVSATDALSLPKKDDGSVDEDRIPETAKLGETGDVVAGSSVTKTFTFKPGTYVAFCNIVDTMGMTGNTGMMGGSGGAMMGDTSGAMPTGTTMGHVHFASGMYLTFTVA